MMKIVVAIDSLKGSLTSIQAGEAIEKGIKKVDLEAEVVIKPLADGGEGTVDALVDGMGGNMEFIKVTGPARKSVLAKYGIIRPTKSDMEETSTAIMEMSQAAGITQVTDKERNPLYTTTYGVGQMIVDAIHKGCRRFIMGIGGSATNDGGVGMLQALGYDFLDKDGNQIKHGAIGLKDLVQIKDADIVITGEGCLDAQTAMGKAPIGVAKLAKKYGKLVLGFSGAVTKGATACNEAGIDAYFPIVRSAVSLEDAMKKKNAQENLIDTVEQVFRVIKALK